MDNYDEFMEAQSADGEQESDCGVLLLAYKYVVIMLAQVGLRPGTRLLSVYITMETNAALLKTTDLEI